ncbi:hypothetical protein [Aliihoeflea sp. PC F10.4]
MDKFYFTVSHHIDRVWLDACQLVVNNGTADHRYQPAYQKIQAAGLKLSEIEVTGADEGKQCSETGDDPDNRSAYPAKQTAEKFAKKFHRPTFAYYITKLKPLSGRNGVGSRPAASGLQL